MKTLFPSLLLIFFMGQLIAQPNTRMAYPQVKATQSSYAATHVPIILKKVNTFEFYKEQSENWWKVLEKDMTDEYAWYNYFKANRYGKLVYGQTHSPSENWQDNTEWIKESSFFMDKAPMEELIKEHLPDSFIFYYVMASNHESDMSDEAYLNLAIKAHQKNPGFNELYDSFVTHYLLTGNHEKRIEFSKKWFLSNGYSPTLLAYYYNVLQSLPSNALLLTYGDNSTYGLIMLQDALQVRSDVTILNVPILSFQAGYRERAFNKLRIPAIEEDLTQLPFQEAVYTIIQHFSNLPLSSTPVYVNQDLSPSAQQALGYELANRGLVYALKQGPEFRPADLATLFEETYKLDYTEVQFTHDPYPNSQLTFLHYLPMIVELYPYYLSAGKQEKANQLKEWGLQLIERSGRDEVKDWYLGELAG